jgi:hypothetical protein
MPRPKTLDDAANGFLAWLNKRHNGAWPLPTVKVVCHSSLESWKNLEQVREAMIGLDLGEHLKTELITFRGSPKSWLDTGAFGVMLFAKKNGKIVFLAEAIPDGDNVQYKFLRELYAGFGDAADRLAHYDGTIHLSPRLQPAQQLPATMDQVMRIIETLHQKFYVPESGPEREEQIHNLYNKYMEYCNTTICPRETVRGEV